MVFPVSVYYARGGENLGSRSTLFEREIVALELCEEGLLILAF
jgi:hypothetical protein